ncbi:tetratricopeptide repeat protein [Streptomyces mayteni]
MGREVLTESLTTGSSRSRARRPLIGSPDDTRRRPVPFNAPRELPGVAGPLPGARPPRGGGRRLGQPRLIASRVGRHADALDHYRHALALRRDLGDTYEEADALGCLAEAHLALGDPAEARATWRQALASTTPSTAPTRSARPRPASGRSNPERRAPGRAPGGGAS